MLPERPVRSQGQKHSGAATGPDDEGEPAAGGGKERARGWRPSGGERIGTGRHPGAARAPVLTGRGGEAKAEPAPVPSRGAAGRHALGAAAGPLKARGPRASAPSLRAGRLAALPLSPARLSPKLGVRRRDWQRALPLR